MLLQDYITQVQNLIHDNSSLDFSTGDLTTYVNNARTRVALDFGCVRQYFVGLNTIVGQETYPLSSGVGGAVMMTGGSGYSPATTVNFIAPGGSGVAATALPVITNGVVTGIAMTSWGTGYTSSPPAGYIASVTGTAMGAGGVVQLVLGTGNQSSVVGFASGDTVIVSGVGGTTEANGTFVCDVIFTPGIARLNLRGTKFSNAWTAGGSVINAGVGVFIQDAGGGSGASASTLTTAMINVIDFHTLSYLCGVQRTTLQWKPFAYFNAVFRSNTSSVGAPAVWSQILEQNLFYLYPAKPDQNYPLEVDAYMLPKPLINLTDNDLQIQPPMNDSVQYYAAHLALLKAQNFDQAEYYNKKYEARRTQISNTRYAVRRLNIYQNVYRRMQRGY